MTPIQQTAIAKIEAINHAVAQSRPFVLEAFTNILAQNGFQKTELPMEIDLRMGGDFTETFTHIESQGGEIYFSGRAEDGTAVLESIYKASSTDTMELLYWLADTMELLHWAADAA